MRTKCLWVLLMLTAVLVPGFSGCNSTSHPPSTAGDALWVATQADQKLRSYAIDPTSGSISAVGANGGPLATGLQPAAIALSPDRLSIFVANSGDNTIGVYTVDDNGGLLAAGTPVQAGTTPTALAVDPADTLLFVANKGSDSIMVYSILPGLLTFKTSFAVQTPAATGGSGPVALVISPAGFSCTDNRTAVPVTQKCFSLYAANQTSGTVTAYDYFVDSSGNFVRGSIDLNGNFLVGGTVPGSPYTAGTAPSALAFSRCAGAGSAVTSCQASGANGLLVTNAGSNTISVFSACIQVPTCQFGESSPDGTLSPLGSPVSTGTGPGSLLVDLLADYVYVVDQGSNQVSEYQYNSTSGALTQFGTVNLNSSAVLSGAITADAGNSANNWVVLTTSSGLSTFGIGSDGSLSAVSAGQTSLSGQPSAILIE